MELEKEKEEEKKRGEPGAYPWVRTPKYTHVPSSIFGHLLKLL